MLLTPASTDQLEKRRTETIRDLDPGTKYESTIQSRNQYGWSEVSQSFYFTTSIKNGKFFDLMTYVFISYYSFLLFVHYLSMINGVFRGRKLGQSLSPMNFFFTNHYLFYIRVGHGQVDRNTHFGT